MNADMNADELERKAKRSALRAFWDERLKLPRRARIVLAWAATCIVFVTCAIVTITYARTFGERRFNILIWTWSFGLAQTFTVQEPLLIWLTLGIPWLVEDHSPSLAL